MRSPSIADRLDPYTVEPRRASCPECGSYTETVFAPAWDVRGLVCRYHPGHPLYERKASMMRPRSEALNAQI